MLIVDLTKTYCNLQNVQIENSGDFEIHLNAFSAVISLYNSITIAQTSFK